MTAYWTIKQLNHLKYEVVQNGIVFQIEWTRIQKINTDGRYSDHLYCVDFNRYIDAWERVFIPIALEHSTIPLETKFSTSTLQQSTDFDISDNAEMWGAPPQIQDNYFLFFAEIKPHLPEYEGEQLIFVEYTNQI